MISLRFTAIASENVKIVISYRAAVTATDTPIVRLQPIDSYEKNMIRLSFYRERWQDVGNFGGNLLPIEQALV